MSRVGRRGIGIGIDSVGGVWGCDSRSVLGGELGCREVGLVAVAVGVGGKRMHGVE